MIGQALYFGMQRLRGGVTRRMIRRAGVLLDRSWPDVRGYVERRLEQNYGLANNDGLHWLEKQPHRNKEFYRDRLDEFADRVPWRGHKRRTSGSTGKPFTFLRDRTMLAWMDAAMWAVYRWYGIEPGDRMARFWGRPLSGLKTVKRHVADILLRQRRMNAFDVSPARSRAFFERLLDWDPKWAYGYPSLMREFVAHLRSDGADGRRLELDVVVTTGELLDRSTRESLADFFGCPVVNEYGCSESGVLAFECTEGRSHVIPVAAYPEVAADPSTGEEIQEGPLLITDLYGDLMPFVRYTLEDAVRLHPPAECDCGRELPRLEVLAGRTDSFIRTPDGSQIYDAVLAYSVPSGVAQFQVRQTDLHRLHGLIVVEDGYNEGDVVEECRSVWAEAVGSELEIEIDVVDRIGRNRSGKRRYFIPLKSATPEDG